MRRGPEDQHDVGSLGTVLGFRVAVHKDTNERAYGYIVLWDGDVAPMLCVNNGRLALMVN
jgi:hypothetical protein